MSKPPTARNKVRSIEELAVKTQNDRFNALIKRVRALEEALEEKKPFWKFW